LAGAKKCKHCGEILDPALREIEMLKKQNTSLQTTIVNNNNNNNSNSSNQVERLSKSRITYILLAVFFGCLGVHNFYAGFSAQLLITLLIGWLFIPLLAVGLWGLIEIFVINSDASGIPFN